MRELKNLEELKDFIEFYSKCVVIYSSLRCPPCRRLHTVYKHETEVAGLPAASVTIDKLSPRDFEKLLNDPKLSLRAVPTIAVYINGEMVFKTVGFNGKDALERKIRDFLKKRGA